MDNNYYYIIASLPDLILNFENSEFSYDKIVDDLKNQLCEKDRQAIKWLEFAANGENLSVHFYRAAANNNIPFIAKYFEFDRLVRNTTVNVLAQKTKQDPYLHFRGKYDPDQEGVKEITTALSEENLYEREKKLDILRWNNISEIVVFDYFNINTILAFIAKAKIVSRWSTMDKKIGAELFEKLVTEVKGTYQVDNSKFKTNKK